MSSITGSCESPANELFKQGLERLESSQNLKADQEEKTAALNIEKSEASLSTNAQSSSNSETTSQFSTNSQSLTGPLTSQQNNNSPDINKGLLINIIA